MSSFRSLKGNRQQQISGLEVMILSWLPKENPSVA